MPGHAWGQRVEAEPVIADAVPIACRMGTGVDALDAPLRRPPLIDAHRFVGASAAASRVHDLIGRLAGKNVTTLIQGETGTGKEIVALLLHRNSTRADAPLVAVNCAAIPDAMLEGELFGYCRGAFSGAVRDYPGKFGLADGGTLFLDEIGELSLAAQAKILRAIETHEVFPLGARRARAVSVRIIAATHRDLCAEAAAGRFRSDLLYRLDVVRVHIPPLSARVSDIPALAQHLLMELARDMGCPAPSISSDALHSLQKRNWPGNVRELRNALEHALVVAQRPDRIDVHDLPQPQQFQHVQGEGPIALPLTMNRCVPDRETLLAAIATCGGCRSSAARLLSLSRTSLYRYLRAAGLDPASI